MAKIWILVIVLLLAMIVASHWISDSAKPPEKVEINPMTMRPVSQEKAKSTHNTSKTEPKHTNPSEKE